MRHFWIIGGIVLVALVIGIILFFFGPTKLQSDFGNALLSAQTGSSSPTFTVLGQGTQAISITSRTNYRITSNTDFQTLWTMVYGTKSPPAFPTVDFSQYEVLALFDGSHSTGGYSINVTGILDANPTRTVTIEHVAPASTCQVPNEFTSPFEIIQVPKTTFTLAHIDATSTSDCAAQ